jgi:uncharacterized protein
LNTFNSGGKIILPGASGFMGRTLAAWLQAQGFETLVLSRYPNRGLEARVMHWDGRTLGPWAQELNGARAVINLTGRSVNCRYNERNKAEIYSSRLDSTRVIGEAIARCDTPPLVWLNAASATIYRHAEDRAMDEESGELGTGFSVDVCQRWEAMLFAEPTPQTRRVAMRTAIVMGADRGGVLQYLRVLARMGLLGPMGNGRQMMSWVHIEDFCRACLWLIHNHQLDGAINIAAPYPVPNADFLRLVREELGVLAGLPAPAWLLEIGAFFLRTETELILKSRFVVPTRLLRSGFRFEHPEAGPALHDLLKR